MHNIIFNKALCEKAISTKVQCGKFSPKSFGKSASLLHVGECTLPLCVPAVACTICNEALWSIMGRYGSITRYYGKLRKHCASLWDVTEWHKALRDI